MLACFATNRHETTGRVVQRLCNTAPVNDLDVYHHGVDPVTAFVLAGGKSSRMGRDKAFLELEGRTLLSLALEAASAVAASVWIVGNAAKFAAFAPVVEDMYSERGPLAGIHAALAATATDLNLILAVDLPFIQTELPAIPDFAGPREPGRGRRSQGRRRLAAVVRRLPPTIC